MQSPVVLLTTLSLAFAAILKPRQIIACNNSPDLCSKSYSEITHLGAHDSPFVRDKLIGLPISGDQYYGSTVQLAAGVRMLTAQIHKLGSSWHLCHTSCDLLDAGLLSDWLGEIRTWMDTNPDDVVSLLLVNSDNATPSQLAHEFSTSGITKYAYQPPSVTAPPTTWPTLQSLISGNTRLMTFIAGLDTSTIDSTNSYLMDEFTFIFENPYDNTSPTSSTCVPDRPLAVKGNTQSAVSSGRMPLMKHFLYHKLILGVEIPDVKDVATANAPSGGTGNLGSSASDCKNAYGKAPTFIVVDFFDQGPAIASVDNLNGIKSPVGRTAVSKP